LNQTRSELNSHYSDRLLERMTYLRIVIPLQLIV
jgi:hypothetical protein